MRFRDAAAAAARAVPVLARDVAGISGIALLAYGSWLIFRPAGFLVSGALLLAGALLSGRADPG